MDIPGERVLKVVLLGDSGVGKSSVAKRYDTGAFSEAIQPTIGLDYALKRLPRVGAEAAGGEPLRIQIWDTAGQERFRSIASSYYRAGQVTALVFDASVPEHHLGYWHDQVRRSNPRTHLVAFANKRDMAPPGAAPPAGQVWCEERGITVYPMSAKTGIGVEEAFDSLAQWAREHLHPPPPAGPGAGGGVRLGGSDPAAAPQRCCAIL